MTLNLRSHLATLSAAALAVTVMGGTALAQKKYDTGATDTEIKVGNINPYSGPASSYGVIGKTIDAYFKKVNAEGGINGRKITFISYDDGYSPPKAVEQVRKLVESDEVLLVFQPLGTPGNTAIHRYMNQKKVPQLFVATGATKWNDPKNFPWTMGWQPNYQTEAQIYAQYILKEKPNAKVAILYQNDDYGKDYVKGLKDGLGAKASSIIVAESPYEVSEPTVDSHIVKLKSSGADVFFNVATPKFAAQAIKKMAEIEWKPMHILNNVSASIGSVIKPAGFENSQGIISAIYAKDVTDPEWKDDAEHQEVRRVPRQVLSGRKSHRLLRDVRLHRQPDPGAYAQAGRRQPDPREHHEGSGEPEEPHGRRPAAGHHAQHQPDQLRAAHPAAAVRFKGETWERFGPILGARGDELAIRRFQAVKPTPPQTSCGGVFFPGYDGRMTQLNSPR